MKAEQLWAQKLADQGCTLPRGKAFRASVTPAVAKKAPAPKKAVSAPKVEAVAEVKPKASVAGLSEPQQAAMAELASGEWVSVDAISARKQTLNALVKKGLVESREQEGTSEYKAV